MKKILYLLSIITLVVSCGNNPKEKLKTTEIITNFVIKTNFVYSFNSSFKVYLPSDISSHQGWCKMPFSVKEWDLGNEFTNNAFTPSSDGIYLLTGSINTCGYTWGYEIRKNGITFFKEDDITYNGYSKKFTILDSAQSGDKYELWIHNDNTGDRFIWTNHNMTFWTGIRLQ